MPKTKLENFVFTVIMAFIMVYAMICYNISLNIGGMTDQVFLMVQIAKPNGPFCGAERPQCGASGQPFPT